jgi:lipid A oxidase
MLVHSVGFGADRRWLPSKVNVGRALDVMSSLAAGVALVVTVAASLNEQAPVDTRDAAVESRATPPTSTLAPPAREWMIGAYSGSPYTYDSDVTIKNLGVHDFKVKDVEWQGKPFINPIYYGVRIARWFDGGNTGSMLDFTHSKAISRPDQDAKFEGTLGGKPAPGTALIKDVFKKLEASHGHNMLTLNGLLRLPSFSARVSPYVGLGAGISLPHSEVHVIGDPSRTYEYQYAGPVGQALIGLEIRLPRMSYFIEYKFSVAPYEMPLTHQDGTLLIFDVWRQFNRWWSGEPPPGGYASTTFISHQVVGGLGVRLGAPSMAAP